MTHLVLGGARVDAAVGVIGSSYLQSRNSLRVERERVSSGWPDALAIPVPRGSWGEGTGQGRREVFKELKRREESS